MYTSAAGKSCFLVVIEGPDRVGKATQASMLEKALTKGGRKTTVEEIPYNDKVTHPEIYRMLKSGAVNKHPVVFQTLQATNRRYFQATRLPDLAVHHDVLVLDRWNLSTHVYGTISGVDSETTVAMLEGIVEPDVTLVFDGDPFPKEGLDVWEADLEFQRKVRDRYLQYCANDPHSFVKIDAGRDKQVVHQECLETVLSRLR